ncbi:ATP-binding protein [Vibrio tritonius]|uniref:ATP-binding protein n=1 Tax=Vibrio tritonius TaxID=1435069 RepID=UPI00083949CF|nr:ATP-binding protein [Vibrio tritonius]
MVKWHFQTISPDNFVPIDWHYNQPLLILSVVLAFVAAFGCLTILEGAKFSISGHLVKRWQFMASVLFGAGAWSTFYTGVLSLDLPFALKVNPWESLLSMLAIITGAWLAFSLLQRENFTRGKMALSAICFTAGMLFMVIIGTKAIDIPGYLVYEPSFMAIGITLSLFLSCLALFFIKLHLRKNDKSVIHQLGIALVLGLAMFILHASVTYSSTLFAELHRVEMSRSNVHSGVLAMQGIVFCLFILVSLFSSTALNQLREAKEDVRQSKTREQDIVDSLTDGLVIVDSQARVLSMNPVGLNLFDYTQDELEKLSVSKLLPSVDFLTILDVQQAGLSDLSHIRAQATRKDGSAFPCDFTLSRMSGVHNERALYTLLVRDISQILMLEQEARQANRMESIGQLASGIAHEINTPAQYLTNNLTFLRDGYERLMEMCRQLKPKEGDEVEDSRLYQARATALFADPELEFVRDEIPLAIDQSLEGIEQISHIVKAMKSFTNVSEHKRQYIDLNEAIQVTVTIAANQWGKIAHFEGRYDDHMGPIPCIRDPFNQVMLSLLVNAVQAIEEKKQHERDHVGQICVATFAEHDHAVIRITDNGVGIDESIIERIFDPFFTTKDVGKGSGQGLSHAYSVIVDQHNGELSVESSLGEGATFVIKLPNKIENDSRIMEEADENLISG